VDEKVKITNQPLRYVGQNDGDEVCPVVGTAVRVLHHDLLHAILQHLDLVELLDRTAHRRGRLEQLVLEDHGRRTAVERHVVVLRAGLWHVDQEVQRRRLLAPDKVVVAN
jgi:hypothetical protein